MRGVTELAEMRCRQRHRRAWMCIAGGVSTCQLLEALHGFDAWRAHHLLYHLLLVAVVCPADTAEVQGTPGRGLT